MNLEDTFISWTKPSSDSEQDKQERTERMIRDAINAHEPFENCLLSVYAKGSYANNTNVRADSDVDIAVECTEAIYWGEAEQGTYEPSSPYQGIWTPKKLRSELVAALEKKFPGQVDTSGSTAIQINSSSARVDADVVPCFTYRYYLSSNSYIQGTKIFTKGDKKIVNYPAQQLQNGKDKNKRTNNAYKKAVRILKRVENAMVGQEVYQELPSYFIECLVYNCPDKVFAHKTWTEVVQDVLIHIWQNLQGEESASGNDRWREVNECFYLFHNEQKWKRSDGREFAHTALNYLGYAS
ncbi:nucleotidyltransferase [Trichocoleus desertorum AS-A10]|uniref:nucleotidyltransferase domain-containing protein n=1 Tax=Trichocoleus desertorum TaxID=1481672 RepID=UPI003299E6C2